MQKYLRIMQIANLTAIVLFVGFLISISTSNAQTIDNTIVEQYKSYLSDIGNVGSRYATAQTFYVTVISTLIAVFSFKEMNRPIQDYLSPASIVVFLFIAETSYSGLRTKGR